MVARIRKDHAANRRADEIYPNEKPEPTPNIGGCSVWSLQLFGWCRYTPACDCSLDLLTLGSAGNPDVVGSQKLGLGLGLDLDVLETPLVLRHSAENQIILTIKQLLQSFQVGFKANRVRGAEREGFAACLLGKLAQTRETHLCGPRATFRSADPRRVYGVDNHVVALADFAGRSGIDTDGGHLVSDGTNSIPGRQTVRPGPLAAKAVNSVCNH